MTRTSRLLLFFQLSCSNNFFAWIPSESHTYNQYVKWLLAAVSGVIVSPNFPGLYPRNTQCTYWLVGHPLHSARLIFSSFFAEGVKPNAIYFTFSDYFWHSVINKYMVVLSLTGAGRSLKYVELREYNYPSPSSGTVGKAEPLPFPSDPVVAVFQSDRRDSPDKRV